VGSSIDGIVAVYRPRDACLIRVQLQRRLFTVMSIHSRSSYSQDVGFGVNPAVGPSTDRLVTACRPRHGCFYSNKASAIDCSQLSSFTPGHLTANASDRGGLK